MRFIISFFGGRETLELYPLKEKIYSDLISKRNSVYINNRTDFPFLKHLKRFGMTFTKALY